MGPAAHWQLWLYERQPQRSHENVRCRMHLESTRRFRVFLFAIAQLGRNEVFDLPKRHLDSVEDIDWQGSSHFEYNRPSFSRVLRPRRYLQTTEVGSRSQSCTTSNRIFTSQRRDNTFPSKPKCGHFRKGVRVILLGGHCQGGINAPSVCSLK